MNLSRTRIVIGAIVAMGSLWFGSYLMDMLFKEHWSAFPTFMTMLVGIGYGIGLIIWGAMDD